MARIVSISRIFNTTSTTLETAVDDEVGGAMATADIFKVVSEGIERCFELKKSVTEAPLHNGFEESTVTPERMNVVSDGRHVLAFVFADKTLDALSNVYKPSFLLRNEE